MKTKIMLRNTSTSGHIIALVSSFNSVDEFSIVNHEKKNHFLKTMKQIEMLFQANI